MKVLAVVAVTCVVMSNAKADISLQERKKRGTYHAVAQVKIILRCIDQDGLTVSNATISTGVSLDGTPGTTKQIKGKTDNNGCFAVEGRSNGELGYYCTKEGFYDTWEVKQLSGFPDVFVSNGRWQPYGLTNTVVLKRKVNPVPMYVRQGELDKLILPKLDEWTGFDLECADWVSPHGKGKCTDFQVYFHRGETNQRGAFRQFALTFRFLKPFDGVYRARKDKLGSQFKCAYKADTNHVYETEINFSYERTTDPANGRAILKDELLAGDEYLVLRIRSETDKEGRLIKANYAKMYAPLFAAYYGFQITSYFNPESNSPSLEADTTRNLLNPRGLGFPP